MAEEDPDFTHSLELNFQHPELVEFLAYWNTKRGGKKFPDRADIIPREIINILPQIILIDLGAGGREPRIRLMGTEISEALGPGDHRGKLVSEVFPPLLFKRTERAISLVQESGAPVRTYAEHSAITGRDFQGNETCVAPLSSNGTDINMIIIVTKLGQSK